MKKVYSFALIIAAVLSSLTSCQKDSLIPQDEPVAEGLTSFVAYMDSDVPTKTTIDGLKISWKDGDQVNVNGSIYKAAVDKSNPAMALFTLAAGQTAPTGTTLRAYYPASAYDAKNALWYTLQLTQTYNGNDVSTIDYLYAQAANTSENIVFTFKHVTGILALDLVGEEKVTSIQITAPTNSYLSGTITNLSYNSTTGKIAYSAFHTRDRVNTVTLDCGTGVQLNKTTPTRFYISLPEKTYSSLEIKINTASGKTMTINSTKSCPVTKGKLFTLPQIEVKIVRTDE